MLLESIRDVEFGEAVKSLARELEKMNDKKQYVAELFKDDDVLSTITQIVDDGGHIDQVIEDLPCYNVILYTADKRLY